MSGPSALSPSMKTTLQRRKLKKKKKKKKKMSNALLRRNSSKQGLKNLMKQFSQRGEVVSEVKGHLSRAFVFWVVTRPLVCDSVDTADGSDLVLTCLDSDFISQTSSAVPRLKASLAACLQLPASISEFLTDTQLFPGLSPPLTSSPIISSPFVPPSAYRKDKETNGGRGGSVKRRYFQKQSSLYRHADQILIERFQQLAYFFQRLTAQRSVEDAEELERERRRRARESYCWTDGGSMPGETSPEDGMPAEESIHFLYEPLTVAACFSTGDNCEFK
ncbi:hypothetical protein NQZ68_030549, partial [Dissostichus eleginoides]